MSIGKHYETGESIPDEIYKKLLAARTFRAGSLSLRQVCASLSKILCTPHAPRPGFSCAFCSQDCLCGTLYSCPDNLDFYLLFGFFLFCVQLHQSFSYFFIVLYKKFINACLSGCLFVLRRYSCACTVR